MPRFCSVRPCRSPSGSRTLARHRHPCPPGHLVCAQADKPESALVMLPGENNQTYVAALTQVLAPLEYRLQIGDSQTRLFKVSVYEKPTIAEVEVTYDFPAYLERPRGTVRQNHADLEAPSSRGRS